MAPNLRKYLGAVKAVILDWSGTVSDKYVLAPAVVFRDVFAARGVDVSMAEARRPMGLRKDLHIKAMLLEDRQIRNRWTNVFGVVPTQKDVDALFADFVPKQLACLEQYTDLIPGARDAIAEMRTAYGVKIGSTTGFTRPMVDILEREANKQGVYFDCTVAGDEVETGFRPTPHMLYKNLDLLGIQPIQSVIKVDDTVGGIGEGLNAGCWTIGVSRYSNYMDIDSLEHEGSLTAKAIEERHYKSKEKLLEAGAHYVVDSIAQVPPLLSLINGKLAAGKLPSDDLERHDFYSMPLL